MAQPLSFLFNVHTDQAKGVANTLTKAFMTGGDKHPLPNIVHYLWLIHMPDQVGQPPNTSSMLLTTVYDENFRKYVQDIAKENPQLFDAALPHIVGMENMVPVLSHLEDFADFIEKHDLTNGGTIPTFVQNYDYSVLYIWNNCS